MNECYITASSYEIRYSESFSEIADDFDNQTPIKVEDIIGGTTDISSPRMAGENEQVIIQVPNRGKCRPSH